MNTFGYNLVERFQKIRVQSRIDSMLIFLLMLIMPGYADAELNKRYTDPMGMEFVLILPGKFTMGSPPTESLRSAGETAHPVHITEPFYMSSTEVTLSQWWKIMGKPWFGRRKGTPDMPVTRVSWFDCIRFVNRLNEIYPGAYRLPTEAQWEYASRAGSRTAFFVGDVIDCSQAMFGNNSSKSLECVKSVRSRRLTPDQPAPVKSYPPNAWGLFDMHGNVWEWCQDWYGPYPSGAVENPQGPESGAAKVRRGGSFFGEAERCRSANRAYAHPTNRLNTTGFRLVWSPTGKKMQYLEQPPFDPDTEPDGP